MWLSTWSLFFLGDYSKSLNDVNDFISTLFLPFSIYWSIDRCVDLSRYITNNSLWPFVRFSSDSFFRNSLISSWEEKDFIILIFQENINSAALKIRIRSLAQTPTSSTCDKYAIISFTWQILMTILNFSFVVHWWIFIK